MVVTGGVITERGSHHELMRYEGEYRRLFDLQAEGYADTAGSGKGSAAVLSMGAAAE